MEKINKDGLDIKQINIDDLKMIFPSCVKDGKIDFEMLKVLLGDEGAKLKEQYSFDWVGKKDSIKFSITPSKSTLIPCKDDSLNWDTTSNIYIKGDNAEVLKTLQKTYYNGIKMIYIDPPYNTGGDFIYHDNFHNNLDEYLEDSNQQFKSNPEGSGRYHTNWLNMMYSRLLLARNLLSDDGVIFISIDDNEIDNLKKICTEIFGEDNFIGCAGRITKKSNNKGDFWAPNFDYLLTYANMYSIYRRS